jgi:hypothetical protein
MPGPGMPACAQARRGGGRQTRVKPPAPAVCCPTSKGGPARMHPRSPAPRYGQVLGWHGCWWAFGRAGCAAGVGRGRLTAKGGHAIGAPWGRHAQAHWSSGEASWRLEPHGGWGLRGGWWCMRAGVCWGPGVGRAGAGGGAARVPPPPTTHRPCCGLRCWRHAARRRWRGCGGLQGHQGALLHARGQRAAGSGCCAGGSRCRIAAHAHARCTHRRCCCGPAAWSRCSSTLAGCMSQAGACGGEAGGRAAGGVQCRLHVPVIQAGSVAARPRPAMAVLGTSGWRGWVAGLGGGGTRSVDLRALARFRGRWPALFYCGTGSAPAPLAWPWSGPHPTSFLRRHPGADTATAARPRQARVGTTQLDLHQGMWPIQGCLEGEGVRGVGGPGKWAPPLRSAAKERCTRQRRCARPQQA